MLTYKLKTVFRYFSRARNFTMLNILGLVIGITLFILISLLLNFELSYDGFHPDKNKILQVCGKDLKSGELSAFTALPLPMTLADDFPEVKYVVGIWPMIQKESLIKYGESEFSGMTGASAEPDIFNIFGYEIIQGDARNALRYADQIAISRSAAFKLFGSENPIGKSITIQQYSFTISQVFKDLPENSSVKYDLLFSDKIREKITADYKYAWWNSGINTYVILQENSSIESFNRNLESIPDRYYPDFLKGRSTYFTIPFTKIHFNAAVINYNHPAVSYAYLLLLGSIAFIVLLIACVNYINLTLARAFRMNREAGIRRIVGAGSGDIFSLQLLYSFFSVFAAFLISIPVCRICLPYFEQLAERPLADQLNNTNVWIFAVFASAIVALISGFIPGRLFSRVNLAGIIKTKGIFRTSFKETRNGLLVFQFTLTIALIISQFFIIKQIAFMKNADLGFDNNNLLSISVNHFEAGYEERYTKSKLYKEILEKKSTAFGLSSGTITENLPGYYYQNSFTVNPVDAAIDECLVVSTAVDENFSKVFGVSVVQGRFFSEEFSTDRQSFIINETAMRKFGWKDIEGKYLKLKHEEEVLPVIGVMKDIHITTLKQSISPMIYRFGQFNSFPAFLTFRIDQTKTKEALELMKKEWAVVFPGIPFDYLNVKETYFKNYEEEQRLSKIVGIFAVLAIALSLLGLVGLIAFYAESRTKEIGIRKVNGAHAMQVVTMLNIEFIKRVVTAFVIACPIAWYAMHKWLQNFTYRTDLSWWVFAAAGAMAVAVALLTVSWQSWRAATRNPVESLRYE
jgi:putative ABC transport system permease protein